MAPRSLGSIALGSEIAPLLDERWPDDQYKVTKEEEGNFSRDSSDQDVVVVLDTSKEGKKGLIKALTDKYPETEGLASTNGDTIEYIVNTTKTVSSRGGSVEKERYIFLLPCKAFGKATGGADTFWEQATKLKVLMDTNSRKNVTMVTEGIDSEYGRKVLEAVFCGSDISIRLLQTAWTKKKDGGRNNEDVREKDSVVIVKAGECSYGDTLKKVKDGVDIRRLGISVKSVRKLGRGDLAVTVEGGKANADKLRSEIRSNVKDIDTGSSPETQKEREMTARNVKALQKPGNVAVIDLKWEDADERVYKRKRGDGETDHPMLRAGWQLDKLNKLIDHADSVTRELAKKTADKPETAEDIKDLTSMLRTQERERSVRDIVSKRKRSKDSPKQSKKAKDEGGTAALKAAVLRLVRKSRALVELARDSAGMDAEMKSAIFDISEVSDTITKELGEYEQRTEKEEREREREKVVSEEDLVSSEKLKGRLDQDWPEEFYRATKVEVGSLAKACDRGDTAILVGSQGMEEKYLKVVKERFPVTAELARECRAGKIEYLLDDNKIRTSRGNDSENSRYIFLVPTRQDPGLNLEQLYEVTSKLRELAANRARGEIRTVIPPGYQAGRQGGVLVGVAPDTAESDRA
ncbi:unnamed protein product [Phaedon cochleariae]|uniref:Uncharacterized protein n=1 Tax=Phaedon cochleariae TaxID=80249 RepID=A0A9N9S9Z1_PHACE|nr:unnamed protein product [Phaedon cochleariae]